ncbi:MAG: flagellar biosynthetic protein FliO [Rhizobiaceae bacterium]|nr:flagellar biosynthetic protein FliO [Rhizobiaceae bacterium]
MRAWLESVAGPEYASAMIWTLGALILLLVILIIVRVVRGLTFGTFVAGGRNRKTRLAVMDATAVDSHRRLVLVRRDDVEHLVLIGGPTDIVVEQNIRLQTAARRPAPVEPRPVEDVAVRQAPESLRPPQAAAEPPAAPQPAATPKPAPAPASPASLTSRISSALRPASGAVASTAATAATAPAHTATKSHQTPEAAPSPKPAAPAAGEAGNLDDALLKELEVTLGDGPARNRPPSVKPEAAADPGKVEDEMSRLLGEISNQREKSTQ